MKVVDDYDVTTGRKTERVYTARQSTSSVEG